jgi:hypothetical protein
LIPYATLLPGKGFRPVRSALYYAQRLVTLPAARRGISRLIAAGVNLHARHVPRPPSAPIADVLRQLDVDGLALLPPLAPEAAIDAMADYFHRQPVVGPDGERRRLEDLPAGAASTAYDLATVLNCPGLIDLINADPILQIAEAYLGCKPTLSSLGVRWSLPTDGDHDRYQLFHRDVDDWRFLKLFIYLNDVDEDTGPHCYVRTSHRTPFSLRAREYRSDELAERFGADAVQVITGGRGTTFIADTVGIHRGGVARLRPRLMLQVQYSILPIYAFSYRPVAAGAPAVDRYSNRLLLEMAA